jgi:hypothetical protein
MDHSRLQTHLNDVGHHVGAARTLSRCTGDALRSELRELVVPLCHLSQSAREALASLLEVEAYRHTGLAYTRATQAQDAAGAPPCSPEPVL